MAVLPRRFALIDRALENLKARLSRLRVPFEGRTERLIALGRVVLAAFSLFAIWLDPSSPAKYETWAYSILAAYLAYALGIAFFVLHSSAPLIRLPLVSHISDLACISVLLYFTEGVSSPFFVYFVFALVCATMRWQRWGVLWTALAIMVVFLGIGLFGDKMLHDPHFELNRFVIRSIYLGVVAVLLGYLGAHESHRQKQLGQLADWSRELTLEADKLTKQVLERAGSILGAPRVLMIWEEPDEPWLHAILFAGGEIQRSRKPPGSFGFLVDAALEGKSFLSHDVRGSTAVVSDPASTNLQHWRGAPLDPAFEKSFAITSVVAVNLAGANLKGRLFFLDKSALSTEDLPLAEVVAGQVAATMDLCYFVERLRDAAALEERVRLSRDLHDGVLQSFTAVGLQLQSAILSLKANPEAAENQLRNIQQVVFEEHRELRTLVEDLQLAQFVPDEAEPDLRALLGRLCTTMEQQWSLRVELVMDSAAAPKVSAALARDVYRIVREGLVNAARHAQASTAKVTLERGDRQIRIHVSDNGRGFPFRGHYDQASLDKLALGPASLKSRVASLGGALNIFSSDSGAQLEITLPLPAGGA